MSTRWPTSRRTRPVPPGPRGYPWLGVLPQMRRDSLGFLSAMVRTYGDIVALPFGPVRVYLLCHPEHVAYVLQDQARNYGKSRFSAQVRPLLGQSLATSDGALWRTQRRLVQPAFHRERLAALAGTIITATQAMLARWAAHAAAETALDMLAEMTRVTGEVIVRALFGTALPETVGRTMFTDFTTVTGYLRTHMLTLTPWSAWLPTPGRRQFQAALARLDHLVGHHIQARRQQEGPPRSPGAAADGARSRHWRGDVRPATAG